MSAQSYPTIRLGEAVDRVTKGTTPTTHGYAYTDEGVSFLRVENLQNGVVDTSKVKTFISSDADRFLKRSSLESGDVLISIAGTIGRVAIVRDHDIPANTNQAVAIIRGAAKRFEPVFLRYALESPLLHRHITGEARGGAMQNISLENVRNVIVPIPPLPEQRWIVAEIEKQFTRLEAGVAALRRVQANLKRYRAAVLKAACEGKLVPTETELRRGKSAGKGFEPPKCFRRSLFFKNPYFSWFFTVLNSGER
jgi:type I restriction enzyme S subunit